MEIRDRYTRPGNPTHELFTQTNPTCMVRHILHIIRYRAGHWLQLFFLQCWLVYWLNIGLPTRAKVGT